LKAPVVPSVSVMSLFLELKAPVMPSVLVIPVPSFSVSVVFKPLTLS